MKRKLDEFGDLSPAERQVRDEICGGQFVTLGDGTRPAADAGPDQQVRADFLRYLILGGCAALPGVIPEKGVRIIGALVIGELDLKGARIPRDVVLIDCRFDAVPNVMSAQLDSLYLNGSALPGLRADGLQAEGKVFLRNAVATGEVWLLGANLGGDLDCDGARFEAGKSGKTLIADGLQSRGSVFLRNTEAFGEVRLRGVKLGGDLSCDGAQFNAGVSGKALIADRLRAGGGLYLNNAEAVGEVRLPGAGLGGDLDCDGARLKASESGGALNAAGAAINGNFFLRDKAQITGVLDLTGAQIGSINDDAACWPDAGNLILNRCRYGALSGKEPVTAAARMRWLDLQDPEKWDQDFWPQPWEYFARLLREMGDTEEARQVLIGKEKRQRADRRKRRRQEGRYIAALWRWFWDTLLRYTVRYGHQPLFAFLWLLGFWLFGALLFDMAAGQDAIKPNNAFVLRSAEWVTCAPGYAPPPGSEDIARNTGGSQLDCFLNQPEAASYPAFNALVYSADTLLPIVAMEMQEFWIPDETQGTRGRATRVFLWVQIIAGWALSLLAVAGFSGLVRSD